MSSSGNLKTPNDPDRAVATSSRHEHEVISMVRIVNLRTNLLQALMPALQDVIPTAHTSTSSGDTNVSPLVGLLLIARCVMYRLTLRPSSQLGTRTSRDQANDNDTNLRSSHPPVSCNHHELCSWNDDQGQDLSLNNSCLFCSKIKWVDPGRGNIVSDPVPYTPSYLPTADDVRVQF